MSSGRRACLAVKQSHLQQSRVHGRRVGRWAPQMTQGPCTALQGIPTTRAGSVVTSDDLVTRDLLYTGNPIRVRALSVFSACHCASYR